MVGADVIVVGLGAMGSAAAYQCASRGLSVVGIDRFDPPHDLGSSHGETRITRQAVGEGDAYIPLVTRSHALWRAIEAETGLRLFEDCGLLVMGRADDDATYHGKSGFVQKTIDYARRFAIPHEVLTPAELGRRFPQFILKGDEDCYYEPGGGMVFPERCIAGQLELARRHGARIVADEPVLGIEETGNGVVVRTGRETYEASQAVLSAGAWNPGLAGDALAPLRIQRQVLAWFEPDGTIPYGMDQCPAYIWMHGPGVAFYGFPQAPGGQGVKVATEQYAASLARPEDADRLVDPAEVADLYDNHIAGRLAGLTSRCLRSSVCLYTTEETGRFLIDRLPGRERILVVSACSGHGFKHSAGIGELVAETVASGRVSPALRPFALAAA